MYKITKIYSSKPKNKKFSNILIGIKDDSMKNSKEILIKGLIPIKAIEPNPDKLDILLAEFREFKKSQEERWTKQEERWTRQEEFNAQMLDFKSFVLEQFKIHGWIK